MIGSTCQYYECSEHPQPNKKEGRKSFMEFIQLVITFRYPDKPSHDFSPGYGFIMWHSHNM